MLQGGYSVLDDLILDIRDVVKDQVTSLEKSDGDENTGAIDRAISKAIAFKDKAHELYRRELTYPKSNSAPTNVAVDAVRRDSDDDLVLTVFGNAPQGRHLFTSLQRRAITPDNTGSGSKPLQEIALPNGLATTRVIPPGATDKTSRTLTLGELFPSPRNLPPLQPPKVPKSTTKSTVLGFYHPELTEKSKYRSGSYFSQGITTGHWLDYSNATPSSQTKTKQRERAQSLAGHKPSSTELEMSEMEALFRGAFSSFAPSKDDSAAIVPSSQLSRMWWQRVGQRSFQRLIDAEAPEDDKDEPDAAGSTLADFDEDAVSKAIDEWDDSLVDPSLEEAMGQKSKHDGDVEETLQEVSDLVETLASYQRNRNLTLPTSQDRYSADPVNGDMLRNGSLAQQPSEEEMATYQALKAQLALIIKTLPPFAVARLNSDKLAELNVSTKVEIRTEDYKGVMEEDEPAARARQQQAMQAAATTSRPQQHRTSSVSSASYATHQYSPQYTSQNRSPMPNTPYFQQTPSRAQPQPMHHQRPHAVPGTTPHTQPRPAQSQPYRAPNGYQGYAAQLAKAQTPYSPAMHYPGTQTQHRVASHSGYGHTPQSGTTQFRGYNAGYPGGYPQQQQGMTPQHHPQQAAYSAHANGAGHMAQRQMPAQAQGQPLAYAQSPQASQARPAYAMPQNVQTGAGHQRQYSAGSPGVPPAGQSASGMNSFHTVMDSSQLQRVYEQAEARAKAQQSHRPFTDNLKVHSGGMGVAGLAGIGLGGNVDVAKLAAARASMPGGIAHMSPSPKPHGSPSVNGVPQHSASPASVPASSVSPAPAGGLQNLPPS